MNLKNLRETIGDGIHLNMIHTDKYKSNLISFYIIRPLERQEVTKNALLPLVLKRGTKSYPKAIEIERKLESLYGSHLSIDVTKKGEKQVIRFSLEGPNGKFIDSKDIFSQQLKLLHEVFRNPLEENNAFNKAYIEQEKKNLANKIKGRINDKKQYAIDQCIQVMCQDEPYSLYKYGYIEDLENINEQNLYDHYKQILKESPIEISVVGDFNVEDVKDEITNIIQLDRANILNLPREDVLKDVDEETVIEEMNIKQGKLSLGYRTNIPYEDKAYESFIVASNILGGGPDSKLFLNVREKESLAYYVYSRSFKYKSIMVIAAGIEFDKFDKAVQIIKEQVGEMKAGHFTDKDIEQSKKAIITSIKNMTDSNFSLSEFYLSQALTKEQKTIEMMVDRINHVTKEEIVGAIKGLQLDTIYFLKNNSDSTN